MESIIVLNTKLWLQRGRESGAANRNVMEKKNRIVYLQKHFKKKMQIESIELVHVIRT